MGAIKEIKRRPKGKLLKVFFMKKMMLSIVQQHSGLQDMLCHFGLVVEQLGEVVN